MVHLLVLPTPLLFLVATVHAAVTPRSPSSRPGELIQLLRRIPQARSSDEWGIWARSNKLSLESKYGMSSSQHEKRSSGTNLLVNQDMDSSFYGSIAVGTPAVSYNVILDTGSADLWLADSSFCTSSECEDVPTFSPASSSTTKESETPFNIVYGSGFASGTLVSDNVQMAGFSVPNQVFGLCNNVSHNPELLTPPVSGLLGLGFQPIAASKATPFWETLASNGAWDFPLMAFQLTRFTNDTNAANQSFGGSFTMGFTNSTLFTGDIDYNDIPGGQGSYWVQEMSALTVQGNSIPLPSGSESFAAIDTGTTLIGGPASVISAIYEKIPGSRAGTDDYDGYYFYPCDTDVAVTLAFGGKSWPVSNADFLVTKVTKELCLGAFFAIGSGGSAPAWIVGDAFLKNVYSVYRYNPPSVGFAELSAYALSLNGADISPPTPTIGSVAATVEATSRVKNAGVSSSRGRIGAPLLAMMSVITIGLMLL